MYSLLAVVLGFGIDLIVGAWKKLIKFRFIIIKILKILNQLAQKMFS